MLDICPEPIMNLYFHLEFGFALWDSEGWRQQISAGGMEAPWNCEILVWGVWGAPWYWGAFHSVHCWLFQVLLLCLTNTKYMQKEEEMGIWNILLKKSNVQLLHFLQTGAHLFLCLWDKVCNEAMILSDYNVQSCIIVLRSFYLYRLRKNSF